MSTTRAGSARRDVAVVFLVAIAFGLLAAFVPGNTRSAQDATPTPSSCDDVMPLMSTPMAGHDGMSAATPGDQAMGEMEHDMGEMVEFDLVYIDRMIPHHQSIIALSEVAISELTDPRLIEMAEAIIETQSEEIDELMAFRDEWYPDAEQLSMEAMMAMPGMRSSSMSMETMEQLMSPEALVMAFCEAEAKDLAFIELTIPHHQMAIDSSNVAVEQAVHPELAELAEEVISAQQEEIDLLMDIRAELRGEATPAS